MKNILSYQPGTPFSGADIIEWAKFQIENNTSHALQADHILVHYKNISPNEEYAVYTSYRGTSCGELRKIPFLRKIQ